MRSRRPMMEGNKPHVEPKEKQSLWDKIHTIQVTFVDVLIFLFIGLFNLLACANIWDCTPSIVLWLLFFLAVILPVVLIAKCRWNFVLRTYLVLFFLTYIGLAFITYKIEANYQEVQATAPPTVVEQKSADLETQKAIEESRQHTAQYEAEAKALLDEAKLIPKYTVVHTLKNYRADGGINLYVLIPPADLANDNFKVGIQGLVRKLVQQYGAKTSVEFHDDKRSLNASFREYGSENPSTPTPAEESMMAVHNIASFDGDLAGNIYPNTLTFFPATDTSNPKVGKYVNTLQFDP